MTRSTGYTVRPPAPPTIFSCDEALRLGAEALQLRAQSRRILPSRVPDERQIGSHDPVARHDGVEGIRGHHLPDHASLRARDGRDTAVRGDVPAGNRRGRAQHRGERLAHAIRAELEEGSIFTRRRRAARAAAPRSARTRSLPSPSGDRSPAAGRRARPRPRPSGSRRTPWRRAVPRGARRRTSRRRLSRPTRRSTRSPPSACPLRSTMRAA